MEAGVTTAADGRSRVGPVGFLPGRAGRKKPPVPVTCALQFRTEQCAVTLPLGRPLAGPVAGWCGFGPGAVFAQLVRAASNRGRDEWRLALLRAGGPGEHLSRLSGIRPGAEILFCLTGKRQTQRALRILAAVRRLGIDPADVSPAWMAGVGSALAAGLAPRPYSAEQHAAYLAVRQVGG